MLYCTFPPFSPFRVLCCAALHCALLYPLRHIYTVDCLKATAYRHQTMRTVRRLGNGRPNATGEDVQGRQTLPQESSANAKKGKLWSPCREVLTHIRQTDYRLDPVDLNLPLRNVVQDLYSTDSTQETWPRSCRLYSSHPETRAISYRSRTHLP